MTGRYRKADQFGKAARIHAAMKARGADYAYLEFTKFGSIKVIGQREPTQIALNLGKVED